MNYEKLWNQLKEHYTKRVDKMDGQFHKHAYLHAKSTLNVMWHLEQKDKTSNE